MHRSVIVARIAPNSESAVADIFGGSDATSLPYEMCVERRSLYSFHDIYLHVVDFSKDPAEILRDAGQRPGFRKISDDLRPFIDPYDPNWQKPQDALAREFYRWDCK